MLRIPFEQLEFALEWFGSLEWFEVGFESFESICNGFEFAFESLESFSNGSNLH